MGPFFKVLQSLSSGDALSGADALQSLGSLLDLDRNSSSPIIQDISEIEGLLQQLRELLTNALPDDLLEDEDEEEESSASSEESILSSQEDEDVEEKEPLSWKPKGHDKQQTSTPQSGSPPPLKTPATGVRTTRDSGNRGRAQDTKSNLDRINANKDDVGEAGGRNLQSHHPHRGSRFPNSPVDQEYEGRRREAEGSDYVSDQAQARINVSYQSPVYYPNQGPYYENIPRQTVTHQTVKGAPVTWDHSDPENRRDSQQYEPTERKATVTERFPDKGLRISGPVVAHNTEVTVYPASGDGSNPFQKVVYTGGENNPGHIVEAEHGERYPAVGRTASVDLQVAQEYENMQGQFLNAGASSGHQQIAQLQILYQARGRELEQVTSQLRILQEEWAREKRILNHQLALAQSEKSGLSTSYEQTKQLLAASKDENLNLEGRLQAATAQVKAITTAKEEIMKQLQTTETTVETLSMELTEMQRSQPLARARERQDTVLAEMQRKHEEEMVDLQGRLQRVISELEEKESLTNRLEGELQEHQRSLQQNQLHHGETVNRLTAQLEESQKRCAGLLDQGAYQEVSNLQQQLQTAQNAKQMSENLCKSMQEELSDLKQQLMTLESAVSLGALSPHSPTEGSTDSVVRNLAKEDWSTPTPGWPDKGAAQDQLVQGLRKELERALVNNRNKRNQVATLQGELQSLKKEFDGLQERYEKAEETYQQQAEASNSDLTSEVERLQDELTKTTGEIKSLKDSERRMKEENIELKQQMSTMVMENDEDKRKAIERCQNTCMQLHEDSSRNLRGEMVAQWQTEKVALEEVHQKRLTQLKEENEKISHELVQVKELYLQVCEENNGIQERLKEKIRGDFNKKLVEVKEKCDDEKETALTDQRMSLENIQKGKLMAVKAEKEAEYQEKLREQLELAKLEWSNSIGKQMVKEAVDQCNKEWEKTFEEEISKRLQDKDVINTSMQTSDETTKDVGSKEELENLRQEIAQLQTELKQQGVALRAKDALYESKLANLKQEHDEKMEERERQQEENLEQRLTQARNLWEGIQKHRESKHTQNLKVLTEQWIQEKKKMEEKQQEETKQKVDEAMKDSETIMRKMFNSEISSIKDGVKNKERSWTREKELLKSQLSKTQEELRLLQANLQRQDEDQSQESDQELFELRGKLCRMEQEKKQMEDTLNRELHHLKTRMKEANALTTESIENRLDELQRARQRDRSSSTRSSSDGMRMSGSGTDVEESTAQTDNHQDSHAGCMVELRNQYLNTVTQIRVDVMQYIKEVREHCQQTVRMEVEKARNNTAKRLREHFTLCLKDQLEEDKKRAKNDKRRQSATFMLGALNKFMESKLDGEETDPQELQPETAEEVSRSLQLEMDRGTSSPRQETRLESEKNPRRGRAMSVHFDEGSRDNGAVVNTVTLFPDHFITGDDEDLLQRTFDRMSLLDGSSDIDSVMRSDSPSGDFHSLEEVSLSPSHSSIELDQFLQKSHPIGSKITSSAQGDSSNKFLTNTLDQDFKTSYSSNSKQKLSEVRAHRRPVNHVTVRPRTSRPESVKERNKHGTEKTREDRSRVQQINRDSHNSGKEPNGQFVPLSRKERGSHSKVDQRHPTFKEIRRPVPVSAGQLDAFRPTLNVNLSSASVATEYNDLPENL